MLWGSFGSGRKEKRFSDLLLRQRWRSGDAQRSINFPPSPTAIAMNPPGRDGSIFGSLNSPKKKFTHFSRATQKISPHDSSRNEKTAQIPNSRIFLVCEFVQLSGRFVRLAGEKAFATKIFIFVKDGTGNKRCQKFKFPKKSRGAGAVQINLIFKSILISPEAQKSQA